LKENKIALFILLNVFNFMVILLFFNYYGSNPPTKKRKKKFPVKKEIKKSLFNLHWEVFFPFVLCCSI